MTRIFQDIPLTEDSEVILTGQAHHYLTHVLRVKVGEDIKLFNGQLYQQAAGDFKASVTGIDKKTVRLLLGDFVVNQSESPVDLYLAQAIPKAEKMDFIVQKSVELGVKKILPLWTTRCNVRLDEKRMRTKMAHWRSVLISACEQSGRSLLPELLAPQSFSSWVIQPHQGQCYLFHPQATGKWPVLEQVNLPQILLIGPEGGLTTEEIEAALAQNFTALSLGPRVLRTETAALTAISIFQFLYNGLGKLS